jgi:DNA-binding response OmpR family regulator
MTSSEYNKLIDLKSYTKDKTILIVEDDELILNNISDFCSDYFKQTFCAKDGKEALNTFISNKIDIAIVDLNLPVMNGKDFIKEIKKFSSASIIVLSATSNKQDFVDLVNLKIGKFIPKPFGLNDIASALLESLENNKYEKLIRDEGCRVCKKAVSNVTKRNMEKDLVSQLKNITLDNNYKEIIKRHNLDDFIDKSNKITEVYDLVKELLLHIDNHDKFEKIEVKNTDYIENFSVEMVTKVLSAKEFFKKIENDKGAQEQIEIIDQNVQGIFTCISNLLTVAENFYYNLNSVEAQKNLEALCEYLFALSEAINYFDDFEDVANTFHSMFEFFNDYHYIDQLDHDEIKELLNLEFIAIDLKNFYENVFVNKSADNIRLYADLFDQSFMQLESNIQNVNRDLDDGELDFF